MFKIVSGLMLLLVTSVGYSLTEGRLLNLSASRQTAVFNLGYHDGIREGDYAVIVKDIQSPDKSGIRVTPVARARNIKLTSDSSVWVLYHTYDSKYLVKDESFNVISESNMLNGRREIEVGRVKIVVPKSKEGHKLPKLSEKYQKVDILHDKEFKSDFDVELLDLEEWEKVKGMRYRSALYRSPHKEEFRKRLRLETFEKLVAGYLKRVNDPNFSYERFYAQQMKDEYTGEFRRETNFGTEYADFIHEQSQRSVAEAKLYRTILEKGESWSEDFSDEELTSVLRSVSHLQENDRRGIFSRAPTRYALTLEYGLPVNDPQTDGDPSYRSESRYSVALDLEATPFLRHKTLERFTIAGSVRSNNAAFAVDNFNADLIEWSVALGINWYPLYTPYATEAPVVFIGSYFRSGIARAEIPSANESGNYGILSYPGFNAGLRYIFKNDISLRIVASMETLNLERYKSSSEGSLLPTSTKVFDGRMNVGIGYSF